MKKVLILFYVLLLLAQVQAQTPNWSVKKSFFTDTVIPASKRPLLTVGETLGVNLGVWAFDRYILEGHYAYISMNSVKRNFRKGFYWDNDSFSTNLFNHPYHGSIYYNTARSNGMDFYQSSLYTLGGSLMWELFMECELPSTNDLFATSIGGMAMGEVLFRLSDLTLDNRLIGIKRFGHELLGFILSPGRGLTRILTGEAWKTSSNSGKQFTYKNLDFQIGTGIRKMELAFFSNNAGFVVMDDALGACVDIQVQYGDLYEDENTTPFDYFEIRCGLNLQKNQPIIGNINLMGALYSKKVWSKKTQELYCGLFQHFDYYDSDTLRTNVNYSTQTPFEVGTPASLGGGIIYKIHNPSRSLQLKANLHLNAIVLGGSLSDYYRGNDRKYNWGSGWATKCGIDISWKDRLFLNSHLNHYKIFTWKGYDPNLNMETVDYSTLNTQGDKSVAKYNIFSAQLGYRFKDNWQISYIHNAYFRFTNYYYHPISDSSTSDKRILITYKF